MLRNSLLALLLGLIASITHANAADLSIAIASNFTAPMRKIAQAFKKQTGHQLALSFGSTGKFYAQIKNGAPFEVLFAADTATPERIAQEGFGVADSRFTYAIGTLVLWSKKPGFIDDQGDVLKSEKFERLAMADPKLAPYGAAAQQTLEHLNLWDQLRSKIVTGENISQAYQFVATENAQLGFVALSQVYADGKLTEGSVWHIPTDDYTAIKQDAIILNPGEDNPVATDLLQFMQSANAQEIIKSFGYRLAAP